MNQALNENERLLEQVINKDIMNIVVNSSVDNASVNVHECKKCLKLKTELFSKKDFIEKETYVGSKNHLPMLNKENYRPWSSRLLGYAKSRPNGKLIYNSIMNGPYVRRMIHEPDYTQLYDFLKHNQKKVDDLRAERLAKTHHPLELMANSNNPFTYPVFHQDQPPSSTYMQQALPNNNSNNPQPSFNQNYLQQPMLNPEDITDPTTAMNMTLVLMAKAFKLNYSIPTNNNQRISSNPLQNVRNQVVHNVVQNLDVQNVGNQNRLIVVPRITNQNPNGNGNVVAARAEGIQLQAKEFDLMPDAADLDEIEKVNANCILMAKLQQASASGTQTDKSLSMTQTDQLRGTVDQHPATIEETRAYFESLYNNLVIEVEKDTKNGSSVNTQFSKQSILGKPPSSEPKLYSITPFPKSAVIPKVGIFRINPFKAYRVDNFVPNKHVKASIRTKPITVSQPYVITQNDVNSKTNGFSPKDVKSITKTRRPQPRNNTKSDKVPFKSKSSCLSNKLEKIEENHSSLQSSNYPDHTPSECNNSKLAI
uniref:Uncharacterized protein n=1 Tax=Tanacetum cinerariifolium TaxID=118510 RepID=A0A699HQ70_TANCI|nr:hypothetical protein [Tanacetum cinerariifolium]